MRYLLHARRGVEVFKFDKIHTRETPKTSWRSHAIADITSYAATLPTSGRRSMKSYVSADYVFDSASHRPYEPDDPIHPLNVYGVSKAAGENAVREESKHWLITRTWWLFGASRTSFPEKDPAGGGLPAQDQGRCRSKRVADLFEGFAMAIRDLVGCPRHSPYHNLGLVFVVRICQGGSCEGRAQNTYSSNHHD